MNGYRNAETYRFVALIDDDLDLYHAVREFAGDLLARMPGITDQTLGRNVKDRVFAWACGGGWGYGIDHPRRFQRALENLDPEDHGRVSETEVGETVRDARPGAEQ